MSRHDDRLAAYAFGDLSPEESSRVEAELAEHPEWTAAVEQFRSLRGDLTRLRDVPECQLSPERMRDAILRREMGDRAKPSRRLGWLIGPAASAMVMAGLWVILSDASPNPTELRIRPATSTMAKLPTSVSIPETASLLAMDAPPAVAPRPVASRTTPRTSPSRATSAAMVIETAGPSVRLASRDLPLTSRGDSGDRSANLVTDVPLPPVASAMKPTGESGLRPVDVAKDPTLASPEDEGIVIIRPEVDAATGARSASEVNSNEPIVFGG